MLLPATYYTLDQIKYTVLTWKLRREAKMKNKPSFTFLIAPHWWGGLVSGVHKAEYLHLSAG